MKSRSLSPDVVELLRKQHAQIRRGFAAALLPGPGQQARFDRLRSLLAVHEAAEEAHVHPAVKRAGGGAGRVMRARLTEEASAKRLLHELQSSPARGASYTAKLGRLAFAVVRHAWHEERQEFPLLRRGVSSSRRKLLGTESLVTQMIAPTRSHPRVNGQLANKLAAPVLGPIDRCRDLATVARRRALKS